MRYLEKIIVIRYTFFMLFYLVSGNYIKERQMRNFFNNDIDSEGWKVHLREKRRKVLSLAGNPMKLYGKVKKKKKKCRAEL